jgi:hypothetical protein
VREKKTNSLVESLSRRVDLNPQFSQQQEDAGNMVKLGIIKGTEIQRQHKLVQYLMRSS